MAATHRISAAAERKGRLGRRTCRPVRRHQASDRRDAPRRGVNYAPRLINTVGTEAVKQVDAVGGALEFKASVDLTPELVVRAGPTGFPPALAEAGSIGDKPLRTKQGRRPAERGVFRESEGIYEGAEVSYVSIEATNPVSPALKNATWAPALAAAPAGRLR